MFERSSAGLRDRGAGIAIPVDLRKSLIDRDYLDSDYPFWPAKRRDWIVKQGDTPLGRTLRQQPGEASLDNWSILWKSLRGRVDGNTYREGAPVRSFQQDAAGVRAASRKRSTTGTWPCSATPTRWRTTAG